jgi:hypothetical protein
VYNTLQHTKRLCDFKISLSSERPLNPSQNASDTILKTIGFIESQVVPAIEKNKLRFEAYASLKMKTVEKIQRDIVTFMQQSKMLQASAAYVLAVIRTLCGIMKKCSETFADYMSFPDFLR